MRHSRFLGLVWLSALAMLAASPGARAQVRNSDVDTVPVSGRVVDRMVVDAEGQIIDLGQIFQGMSFSVASDGSGEGDAATFVLRAPANADIALTVIYSDLVRAGTTHVVELGPPDGPAICFRREAGGGCDVVVVDPVGGGIPRNASGGGEGIASVGYTVSVPVDAEPGVYANEDAITLEAEALLGGPPRF